MLTLGTVRIAFLLLAAAALGLAVWQRKRVLPALRRFFFEPEPATNLALLRLFIFGMIAWDAITTRADFLATLSPRFMKFPPVWADIAPLIKLALPWTGLAKMILIASALCAAVGFLTRAATIVTALLAVYVFGIANFYFRLMHNLHIETLCAFLLAASPCGHAISVDNLIRRARGLPVLSTASSAYTFPVRIAWMLLGVSYFYPGFFKLWRAGDLYVQGIKPYVDILGKWTEFPDRLPYVDVDRVPWVMPLLGTFSLIFEIGFTFTLFWRTSRVYAGLAGVGFHLGIMLFMNIWFSPFLPLMVLCDFPGVLRVRPFGALFGPVVRVCREVATRVEARVGEASPSLRPAPSGAVRMWPFVMGTGLLVAMYVWGALVRVPSWPIARFPTFSQRGQTQPAKAVGLVFKVKKANGEVLTLPDAIDPLGRDGVVGHNVVRAIAMFRNRTKGDAAFQQKFRRWAEMLALVVEESSGPFEPGDRLQIYSFEFSVRPSERAGDRRKLKLVAEHELGNLRSRRHKGDR